MVEIRDVHSEFERYGEKYGGVKYSNAKQTQRAEWSHIHDAHEFTTHQICNNKNEGLNESTKCE